MVRSFVERPGLISLDNKYYKLAGPVRSTLGSQFAPKTVIGADSMDSHQDVSFLRWDDWSEGIGVQEFFSAGGEAPKRAWFSTCELSTPGHLVLGPEVVATSQITGTDYFLGGAVFGKAPILAFDDEIYVAVLDDTATDNIGIWKYDNSGNSWSNVHDITTNSSAQNHQHGVVGFIGGTRYIVFTARTDYSYSTDGSSWSDSTRDADYLAIWDDRLWGIDVDGNTWYATTPGTETPVATLPTTSDTQVGDADTWINGLFVAHSPQGESSLYAATAIGLFIYDVENDRWLKTGVTFPEARFNARGSMLWNGDIYVPAGMGMYQVVIQSGQTLVVPMGPDRDHGLPSNHRGAFIAATPGHHTLFGALGVVAPGFPIFVSPPAEIETPLLTWDGRGWQVLWTAAGAEAISNMILATAYSKYRLWFTANGPTASTDGTTVYYIELPSERLNSTSALTRRYAAESVHETPDFRVGEDVSGIALSVLVEVQDTSPSQQIQVEYSTDAGGSFTSLGTLGASLGADDGTTEFLLPNSTTPEGIEFHSIRFRLTLTRGVTVTETPDLRSLTLKFLKKLRSRWHHQVTLDISRETGGFSPRQQWENLRSAIDANKLVEFSFKDDSSAGAEQRYWVKIEVPQGEEETGVEYKGQATLVLKEV